MKNFTFSKYCTPAYLNVALGVAIIIGTFLAGLRPETLALEALFIGIWALGLKWLCSKGYKIISWSLAVVPVILALYMVILVKNDVATKEGIDNKTPGTDDAITKSGTNPNKNIGKDAVQKTIKDDAISNLRSLIKDGIAAVNTANAAINKANATKQTADKAAIAATKAINDQTKLDERAAASAAEFAKSPSNNNRTIARYQKESADWARDVTTNPYIKEQKRTADAAFSARTAAKTASAKAFDAETNCTTSAMNLKRQNYDAYIKLIDNDADYKAYGSLMTQFKMNRFFF